MTTRQVRARPCGCCTGPDGTPRRCPEGEGLWLALLWRAVNPRLGHWQGSPEHVAWKAHRDGARSKP